MVRQSIIHSYYRHYIKKKQQKNTIGVHRIELYPSTKEISCLSVRSPYSKASAQFAIASQLTGLRFAWLGWQVRQKATNLELSLFCGDGKL